jgi:hypothetical protein
MNAQDILKYGDSTFLASLAGIPQERWQDNGVCGVWSTQDIIAHLASYEVLLVEILSQIAGQNLPTPTLDLLLKDWEGFNDKQVEHRREMDGDTVLAEYKDAHEGVRRIATTLEPERFTNTGTLPWYGEQYSLDDYIVYQFYGHKREHAAQLDVFADRL